ncbi:MAG: LPD38 domain-containing protein, partial [Ginsengibacter sp.]
MGSIDIPPFLRGKMKENIQNNSEETSIDIPDFLKKKADTDLSGKRPASYPLSDASSGASSPTVSESNGFDPNTFMQQSRANVLKDNQPKQDNVPVRTSPNLIVKKRTETLKQSVANQQKAKPVINSITHPVAASGQQTQAYSHIDPKDYETKLPADQEVKFKQWLDANHAQGKISDGDYNFYKKNGYGYDYDFRAAFQNGLEPEINKQDGKWHWGDLGKKPNEPTFSTESKYNGVNGMQGGTSSGDQFIQAKKDNFNPTDFLTSQIKTAYPDIDPEEILSHKSTLEQFTQNKLADINKRLDQLTHRQIEENSTSSSANSDIAQSVKLPIIKSLVPEQKIKSDTQQKIDSLQNEKEKYQRSINYFGSIHAGLESGGNPEKAGILLRQFSGDKQALQDEDLQAKGYGNPQTEYSNAKIGLQALNTMLDAQYVDDPANPDYLKEKQDLQKQNSTLLDKYPEVKNKQISSLIGSWFYKDTPQWEIITGTADKPTSEDIKRLAKEHGLSDADIKNIDSDMIPAPQSFASGVVGGLYKGFLGLGASIARVGGSAVGIDKDWLDYHLNEAQQNAEERFAQPQNYQLQGGPTIIDQDKNSSTYLQDIPNPNAGKYNYTGTTLANGLGQGIGGLVYFIAANKGMTGVIGKAAPELLTTAEGQKTLHDMAMFGTMFGGYEGHYQQARQIVGDAPEDEAKRHLLALAGVYFDKRVFDFVPTQKLSSALFNDVKSEAITSIGENIKNLPSNLKGMDKNLLLPHLKTAAKIILDATGETAKINSASSAAIVANHIANSIVGMNNPESQKAWADVPEEIKNTWTSSIFNMLIPIGLADVVNAKSPSKLRNEAIYDAALHPKTYKGNLAKMVSNGAMSPDQAQAKSDIVDAAARMVKTVPQNNPETGSPLNHDQSVKWLNNRLQETAIEAKKAGVKDDIVLTKFYDAKIKGLQAEREDMLTAKEPAGSTYQEPKMTTADGGTDTFKDIAETDKAITSGPQADQNKSLPDLESIPYDQRTDAQHATFIKQKFAKEFSDKGVPQEQVKAATALMDARAKIANPKNPDIWFRQIENIGNGDFKTPDIKYQNGESEIKENDNDSSIDQHVSKAKAVLNKLFPEAKFEAYEKTSDYLDAGGRYGSKGISKVDSEGNRRVMIDLQKLREDGTGHTAFHEVIHPIVDQVVGAHPAELNPLWNDLSREMKDVKGFEEVLMHVLNYGPHEHSAAEGLTELLTHISEGKISLDDVPPARKGIIVELINKLFAKLGISLRIGDTYDFKSFATDIKKAFDGGETEALEKKIGNKVLYQGNKGAVETLANGRKIIHALDAPDFSTAVHELAHVFEDELTAKERKVITDFSRQKEWNTNTSEAFARGFERYLKGGNSPTSELRAIFQKAKEWLTDIYNKLKQGSIKITPDVKEVFDNLFKQSEPPVDDIQPHKEVKASKAIAIKEVASKYNLKGIEASMLHSLKGKDVESEIEGATEGGLKSSTLEKLYEKGFISYADEGNTRELSKKGNDFIKAVDARYETRKNVKAGTDLFPEEANIPELISIKKELNKQIDENTIEQFEQRTPDEAEQLDPVIKAIEGQVTSDNETTLTEAIKRIDSIIENDNIQRPAEDKQQPESSQQPGNKSEQLGAEEIGKVAFARSNSYSVFKTIHPEISIEGYNQLRSSNIQIPSSDLRGLGKEYIKDHPAKESAATEKFYDEIAGSKPTDTGRIPVAPIIGESKDLSKILFDVSKALKQKVFFLKPGPRAAGTYSPGSGAIKIKFTGDLDVSAHEIGHSIDDHFSILKDLINSPNPTIEAELAKFSPYGSKPQKGHPDPQLYIRAEGFAEWLRAFIVNPDEAIKAAPELYKLYEGKVAADYKKGLSDFSNDVRTWTGSTGRDMVLSNIQWEPEKAKGLIKKVFGESNPDNMFLISWVDKLAANWVNPMRAFEKAFSYAKGIKGIDTVLPDSDPTILARLFLSIDRKFGEFLEHGLRNSKDELIPVKGSVVVKDKSGNIIKNGKGKTFKWLIEPLDNTDMATIKKEMQEVTSYMVAERTVELGNKFSRESILTGIGGGIYRDVDVALKALNEFHNGDPKKLERIQEAAKRYREFSDDILRYMVDKGRLAEEVYNEIRNNNVHYVALHRIMEAEPETEIQIFTEGGKKLSSVNQPIKNIKGSTRKIVNPYISLLDAMYKSIKESDRNDVLRAFRDMIQNNRSMYDGRVIRLSEIGVIAKPGDKNTITVFIKGKPEKWALQKDVYEALKGLDNDGYKLPGILTLHTRILRNMTTKFPTFAGRNWIRDFQDRLIKSNDHSGLKDLFGNKEHWRDVARKGGLNAGYYVRDKAHYYGLMEQAMDEISKNQKTIFADPIKIKKLWHGYENILQASETSNRVAEYRAAFRQAKLKGMDDYNAGLYGAFKARDLMDFAVMGHYMKIINQLVPFSNAAVQAVRSSAVRAYENPAGFLGRTAVYSVLPAVALWLWNHRDEETAKEYENLPWYQRDMFSNIKIGDNKWLSIPKPYELG